MHRDVRISTRYIVHIIALNVVFYIQMTSAHMYVPVRSDWLNACMQRRRRQRWMSQPFVQQRIAAMQWCMYGLLLFFRLCVHVCYQMYYCGTIVLLMRCFAHHKNSFVREFSIFFCWFCGCWLRRNSTDPPTVKQKTELLCCRLQWKYTHKQPADF